jgi:hypothetical protein
MTSRSRAQRLTDGIGVAWWKVAGQMPYRPRRVCGDVGVSGKVASRRPLCGGASVRRSGRAWWARRQ